MHWVADPSHEWMRATQKATRTAGRCLLEQAFSKQAQPNTRSIRDRSMHHKPCKAGSNDIEPNNGPWPYGCMENGLGCSIMTRTYARTC